MGARPRTSTIKSSRELFGERPDAVYDVLAYLEPGLMLDVGAAAGMRHSSDA